MRVSESQTACRARGGVTIASEEDRRSGQATTSSRMGVRLKIAERTKKPERLERCLALLRPLVPRCSLRSYLFSMPVRSTTRRSADLAVADGALICFGSETAAQPRSPSVDRE